MSFEKHPDGRRSVHVEIDVPGTPEAVWNAIATGPGVSAWFVPTEVEFDGDGKPVRIVSHFGPGNSMDSIANVTAWDPPHRFAAESADLGPDAPIIATEWIVETRDGGTCTVRVVHSLFASGDDWDSQLGAWENGWPWFFRILRLYLDQFAGQTCAAFRVMGSSPASAAEVWPAYEAALGLSNAAAGEDRTATPAVPALAGRVDFLGDGNHAHGYLLRIHQPGPGIASVFALPMGGMTYLVIDFYLYGEQGNAIAASEQPKWQAWMDTHYPMAPEAPEP
ncbi:MAG: SRPBCC domain-containing protein [Candidatus Hydrogenedentes bacterium]|nr:SRPBCC domain-containing protein [Candidatus Hydrogenedentota bacterium]